MGGIEFYTLGDELWYRQGAEQHLLTEQDPMVQELLQMIRSRYPEALKALEKEYHKSALNAGYYQYLIVRRFCKCNFGTLDDTKEDIAGDKVNFEKVLCPLRGECMLEGVVCQPHLCTTLSKQEERVMRLLCEGLQREEIAERLFISPNTVKNHTKSIYAKLGVHDRAQLQRLATQTGLCEE